MTGAPAPPRPRGRNGRRGACGAPGLSGSGRQPRGAQPSTAANSSVVSSGGSRTSGTESINLTWCCTETSPESAETLPPSAPPASFERAGGGHQSSSRLAISRRCRRAYLDSRLRALPLARSKRVVARVRNPSVLERGLDRVQERALVRDRLGGPIRRRWALAARVAGRRVRIDRAPRHTERERVRAVV